MGTYELSIQVVQGDGTFEVNEEGGTSCTTRRSSGFFFLFSMNMLPLVKQRPTGDCCTRLPLSRLDATSSAESDLAVKQLLGDDLLLLFVEISGTEYLGLHN